MNFCCTAVSFILSLLLFLSIPNIQYCAMFVKPPPRSVEAQFPGSLLLQRCPDWVVVRPVADSYLTRRTPTHGIPFQRYHKMYKTFLSLGRQEWAADAHHAQTNTTRTGQRECASFLSAPAKKMGGALFSITAHAGCGKQR